VKRFRLKTIASGKTAGLWVSLGFSSSLTRRDVLHIVSGNQATPAGSRSRSRLYVERFDQLYSCNGGCDLVRVGPKSIEVHLTPEAAHLLSFKSNVLLFAFDKRPPRWPGRQGGYAQAMDVFRAMADVSRRVEIESGLTGAAERRGNEW
jgi:hypothetical protein